MVEINISNDGHYLEVWYPPSGPERNPRHLSVYELADKTGMYLVLESGSRCESVFLSATETWQLGRALVALAERVNPLCALVIDTGEGAAVPPQEVKE
jgi:hypothetical protein